METQVVRDNPTARLLYLLKIPVVWKWHGAAVLYLVITPSVQLGVTKHVVVPSSKTMPYVLEMVVKQHPMQGMPVVRGLVPLVQPA